MATKKKKEKDKYFKLLSIILMDPEGKSLLEGLEMLAAERVSYAILASEDCLTIKLLYDEDVSDEDVKFMTGGYSTGRKVKPEDGGWLGPRT